MRTVRPRVHPRFAQGLRFLIVGGIPVDLVSGNKGTLIGAATMQGKTPYGPAFESTVNTGVDGIWWSNVLLKMIQDQHTLMTVYDWDALVTSGKPFCCDYRADTTWTSPWVSLALDMRNGTSGDFRGSRTVAAALTDYDNSAAIGFVAGSPDVIHWTRDRDLQKTFKHGIQVDTSTAGSTGVIDWNTSTHYDIFTRSKDSTGEGADGRQSLLAGWGRVLSGDEISCLGHDPYQLFAA